MTSSFSDILNEFDLEFFDHSGTKDLASEKWDKQRKAVLLAKKKIVATNSLVKAYYDKKNALDFTEKCLYESKIECKQVCVNYNKALEKCAELEEQETKNADMTQSLNERLIASADEIAALQSHTNQLEVYVQELKKQVEGYEIEKRLEMDSSREYTRKIKLLESEKQQLENDLCLLGNVVVGSKEIDYEVMGLLKKYNVSTKRSSIKIKDIQDTSIRNIPFTGPENVLHEGIDLSDAEQDEGNEDNIVHTVIIVQEEGDAAIPQKICDNDDADYFNDMTSSVDTGRGSSLSLSPEYSLERPYADTERAKLVQDANSVKEVPSICDRGVSPINFECDSVFKYTQTSPKQSENHKHIATSPINCSQNDAPARELADKPTETHEIEIDDVRIEEQETDPEVESIFKAMRLRFEELAPLPATPAPSPVEYMQTHNVPLESEKIWKQFELLTARIDNIEKELKDSQNVKLKRKMTDIVTETCSLARRKIDSNNAEIVQSDAEMYEEDIISIPINEMAPSHSEYSINAQKKSCSTSKRLQFSDPLVEDLEKTSSAICESSHVDEVGHKNVSNAGKRKQRKAKTNPTKLQKLKVSLIPKSKIKHTTPTKSSRLKGNQLKPLQFSKAISKKAVSSKTLNDKAAYEKALAVVAEIRAKELCKKDEPLKRKSIASRKNTDSEINNICKIPEKENTDSSTDKVEKVKMSSSKTRKQSNSKPITRDISPKRRRQNSALDVNSIIESSGMSTRSMRSIRSKVINSEKNNNDILKNPDPIEIAPNMLRVQTNSNDNIKSPEVKIPTRIQSNSTEIRPPLKRPSIETEDVQIKRKLRSFSRKSLDSEKSCGISNSGQCVEISVDIEDITDNVKDKCNNNESQNEITPASNLSELKDYNDLNLFDDDKEDEETLNSDITKAMDLNSLKDSLLCKMIEKHAVVKVRTVPKKIPEKIVDEMCKSIEEGIEKVLEIRPVQAKAGMDELVRQLSGLPMKQFLRGLMKYLQHPDRKVEMLSKSTLPPLPPMSKQQQVLLYLLDRLQQQWPGLRERVLELIEYALFRLNNTPEFATIEALSQVFALLCRNVGARARLRQLMLDAMYCMGFKAVPLVRQCLEVWPQVLPLAHMSIALQPLVTCLVYLLHFYKCDDVFHRVQAIRTILHKKYHFQIADWTEAKIIDMLRSAILDKREGPAEKKMLRMAIIILAKRNGARWCDKNIIKGLLQPLIEDTAVPESKRMFCIELLGPLLRPFPNDMRVHREVVVNQLFDLLDGQLSAGMEEAVISSLVCASRHDARRTVRALLLWRPRQPPSSRLQRQLAEFVTERPLNYWKNQLAKALH